LFEGLPAMWTEASIGKLLLFGQQHNIIGSKRHYKLNGTLAAG